MRSEAKATCIRCGHGKRYAPERCNPCGFTPRSNADLAKSFILSAAFDVGDQTIGRAPDELARIAETVAGGRPYAFSDAEVAAVEKQVAAFAQSRPGACWRASSAGWVRRC